MQKKNCVFVFFVFLLACPRPSELKGERFLDEYVIEVEPHFSESAINLTPNLSVEVSSVQNPIPTDNIRAENVQGIYYIVFPNRFSRENIDEITLSFEGYETTSIDYKNYPKQTYTPTPTTVRGVNIEGMCDYQKLVPEGVSFIEFAMKSLFEPTVYASSQKYECKLTYRERDKIDINFEVEQTLH